MILLPTTQVSYAIGVAEPISITLFDYGTSRKTQKELLDIVRKNFDLRPGKIVKYVFCRTNELPTLSNISPAKHVTASRYSFVVSYKSEVESETNRMRVASELMKFARPLQ